MTYDAALEALRLRHRQKVEEWLSTHMKAAGIDPTNLAEVKRRCMLIQGSGILVLQIDGKTVNSMLDAVL